jgi:hypothetical protein
MIQRVFRAGSSYLAQDRGDERPRTVKLPKCVG